MSPRSLAHYGLALAICASGVLLPAPVQAATVTITETSISRTQPLREQAKNPYWINKADCLADDVITFPLFLADFAGLPLEVWAGGTDCKDKTTRQGTSPSCWIVYKGTPTVNTWTVQVRVQDIVGQHKPTETSEPGAGTADDCEVSSGTTAPIAVTLFFMFIDQGSNEQQGGVSWATKYDLAGPNPPGGVTVGQGDTLLKLDWTQSADTDLTGYQFFCDPPRGSEGANSNTKPFEAGSGSESEPAEGPEASVEDDAEACDPADAGEAGCPEASTEAEASTSTKDAATDSGSTSGSGCPTVNLIPGELPDQKYLCGSASGFTSTSGRVSGLINKTTYSIAVAGVDSVGNVGRLSNVVCSQPWPVDDFFKLYKEAGGEAGGTFCSTGAVGHGAGMATLLVLSLGALGGVVRRRRRNV